MKKINEKEFNLFSLFYLIYIFRYLIISITFLAILLAFLYYTYSKKEYYSLSINLTPSNKIETTGLIDVPGIISENFNMLLGMVLSSSATRNMGINLPPFNVSIKDIEKINNVEKFIFQISDTKVLFSEIEKSNLLNVFKNTNIEEVSNHLLNLSISQKDKKTLVLNFKMSENINIDAVDLIITAGLNIVLRDLVEEGNELKASISELMEVITEQYFIDLTNRVEILQEKYLIAKSNKRDLEGLIKNYLLKSDYENNTSNSEIVEDSSSNYLDYNSLLDFGPNMFFPSIIKNEIEILKNRKNHEAFIPGKSILKNTFHLISSNHPAQKIKQSLKSPGYYNDKFKFISFNSPELKDILYFKTDIAMFLFIGLIVGLFLGVFMSLILFFYQIEKKNFIKD